MIFGVSLTTVYFVLMREWVRALCRFLYFGAATILHIAGYVINRFAGKTKEDAGRRIRRHWLERVPGRMGLRIEVSGHAQNAPCLFVANHISYLDPIIILMHIEADVVAKSEVKRWPLIGLAGSLVGTIFVNRHQKSSRQLTAEIIYGALKNGKSILLFPEGTTTRGNMILPFRPRSFDAARSAEVPVQPVMIRYEHPSAAFVDDQTFIPHFFTLFRQKRIHAIVTFGPVFSDGNTCEESHAWMQAHLSPHTLTAV